MKKLLLSLIAIITFTVASHAQLRIESLYENWNGGQWENLYNYTYAYNWNLEVDNSYAYEWNEGQNFWEPTTRIINTYNANVKITETLTQQNNNGWDDASRILYTYNGNGYEEDRTYQNYSNNMWVNLLKSEHTYDGNGNITQTISYLWDSNNSLWMQSDRTISTYMGNVVVEELFEYYDELGGSWLTNGRTVYTLNGNNQHETQTDQEWVNGGWMDDEKIQITYNGNGDIALTEKFDWNDNTNSWDPASKNDYIYNNDMQLYQTISQAWINNSWLNVGRFTHTYGPYQSVEELGVNRLHVYPNPASDIITVNLENTGQSIATIFNAEGKVVDRQVLSGKINTLPLGRLPIGNYFIQLMQGNKAYSGNFIKQ